MREPATDARVIGATVKIEICKKVEKAFRRSPADSMSTIYARALEESVRDVVLTATDYKEIAAIALHGRKLPDGGFDRKKK